VGECVIIDASGEPFANDGDKVECGGGGGAPSSRVEGAPTYFYAWELRVFPKSGLE